MRAPLSHPEGLKALPLLSSESVAADGLRDGR